MQRELRWLAGVMGLIVVVASLIIHPDETIARDLQEPARNVYRALHLYSYAFDRVEYRIVMRKLAQDVGIDVSLPADDLDRQGMVTGISGFTMQNPSITLHLQEVRPVAALFTLDIDCHDEGACPRARLWPSFDEGHLVIKCGNTGEIVPNIAGGYTAVWTIPSTSRVQALEAVKHYSGLVQITSHDGQMTAIARYLGRKGQSTADAIMQVFRQYVKLKSGAASTATDD